MSSSPRPRRLVTAAGLLSLASALALVLALGTGAAVAGAAVRPAHAGGAHAPEFHPLLSITAPGSAFADSQSDNWSGYNQGALSTDTTYSSISGEWTVPTATQHTAGQAEDSATWIGIGGGCLDTSCTATDSTLIQAGTEQDVASDGSVSYSAWWEIVPAPSVTASITVSPGDLISCDITETLPELWTITLSDLTNGQSFTETVPYPSTQLTAEWIEETPVEVGTSGAGIAALPNLSTVSFTGATVNGSPADLQADQAIQLTDSTGTPIATPSAPGSGNASFNDCTYASTCAAP